MTSPPYLSRPLKGFSAAPEQFSTASTVDKGHGRVEHRTLRASEELKDYLDWPHAQQVLSKRGAAVMQGYFSAISSSSQSIQVSIDGKSLRGSIPSGQNQGVHLLAAFVPQEGWVLLQVEVDGKENEITAAPRLLKTC